MQTLVLVAWSLLAAADQPPLGVTTRAHVTRILDGDTVELELRLPIRVRLLDCWAPELRTLEGPAAKEALAKLLPVGSKVVLHVPTDKARNLADVLTFGRVLGHIWRKGKNASAEMVKQGHATKDKQK